MGISHPFPAQVKLSDPDTVLACSNVGATESGFLYEWKWRDGAAVPSRVNGAKNPSSHDVQLAANGEDYWQPEYVSLVRRSRRDGSAVATYGVCAGPGGMNHAQLLEGDTRALVSCRSTNSVVLYDVANEAVLWSVGGEDATLALVGDVFWAGQHNAELFGDAVYLFDNALSCDDSCDDVAGGVDDGSSAADDGGADVDCYAACDGGTPSRVLRFRVDEARATATVDWTWEVPLPFPVGYAKIFGDADLLPGGDVLTSYWFGRLAPSLGATADATFAQITPEKAVAWQMEFFNSGDTVGGKCDKDGDAGCERSQTRGWKAYSVERFYDGPVVSDATVDGAGGLAFTAHCALKRQGPTAGAWAALDDFGAVVAEGAFAFDVQSLPTRVFAAGVAPGAAALRVVDEWDQATDVPLLRR